MGRAGVAQLAVSHRGRCFVVFASRSLRGAKKHPTAVILGNSVLIRVPARIPLVSTARALGSARRPQGGGPNIFASSLRWFRASRLAGVCRSSGEKIEVFVGIAPARLVLF